MHAVDLPRMGGAGAADEEAAGVRSRCAGECSIENTIYQTVEGRATPRNLDWPHAAHPACAFRRLDRAVIIVPARVRAARVARINDRVCG